MLAILAIFFVIGLISSLPLDKIAAPSAIILISAYIFS